MRGSTSLGLALGVLLAALPTLGAARGTQDVRERGSAESGVALERGGTATGTLAPGATARYDIPADAGTFVRVVVDGHGMRLRVTVRPPGEDAGGPDAPRTRTGGDRTPVAWSVVASSVGPIALQITSAESADVRPYTVLVTESRPAEPDDDSRAAAERLLEADTADKAGDAARALDAARRAHDAPLQIRALLRAGGAHAEAGRSADAERAFTEARDRCADTGPAGCDAEVQLAFGRLLSSTGRPDPGIAAFEAARRAAEGRGDRATAAEALLERGGVEIAKAQQDRARSTLTEAVAMARAAGHRRAEADALNMLGILTANLGEAEASEANYTAALALRRTIGDDAGQAQTQSNLGALANTLGEYRRALGSFDEALATRRRLGLAQATANTLHNLGVAQANLGALETALGHLEEALGLWQKTGGRRGEAFALQELGQTYARLGDRARALDHWRRALPLWTALGDRRGEVQTVLFAAALEQEGDGIADATASYTRALDLSRAAQLRREEGLALLGLAGVARRRGAHDDAMARAREALAIFDALPNRRERGRTLAEIGSIHLLANRLTEARAALDDAVQALDAVEDRAEAGRVAVALADVDARLGHADAAVADLERGLARLESVRRDQQAESFNLSVFASDRPLYDQAIGVLMRLHRDHPGGGYEARAFHVSERRRARRLLDMVAAAAVDATDDAARDVALQLRRLEERISAKATRLTRLLSDAPAPSSARTDAAREDLRQLVEGADRLRAELRRRHQAPLSDPPVLDAAAVQAELDPGVVLLEYAIGDTAGVGWVVTSSAVQAFAVPGRDRLEPLVRAFIDVTSGRAPAAAADDPGRALATALLGPATTVLDGARRIVVVGDGVLDALPYAALPRRGAPLASRLRIDTVPSASVAAALRSRRADRPPAASRVAVFADPVYSPGDGRLAADRRAAAVGGELLRLRFSREEARAIERAAPNRTTLFLDFAATRARAIDGALRGYRYLHWASHARIDERVPQLSTIELSRVDVRGQPIDGALRLIDVYGLTLNADLVVLSACETALGAPVGGEGLVGFASGFLRAGADRVLASLWDVDDRAAAAFMTRFYDALLRQARTPEAAFHDAQRALRLDPRWRAPKDWAGWVLIGGGDRATGRRDARSGRP